MLTCHGTRKHIIRDPRQSMTFNTSVILLSLPVNSNNVRLDSRRSLVSGLCLWWRSAGSFPEQWMVIEPITMFSGEKQRKPFIYRRDTFFKPFTKDPTTLG